MPGRNSNLHDAKRNKNDEFYTQLTDIEKEVKHYKDYFKDKVVFLNCDDPEQSNFWFFFQNKFVEYGLKRLVSTHYSQDKTPSYKLEIIGDQNGDGIIDANDIIKTPLKGVGDFRDEECVKILDESDIVVTNPPFSLFREFIDLLIKHNKKFLVIGPDNAITNKDFFPYIKEGKVWLGYEAVKIFRTPLKEVEDPKKQYEEDGVVYQKFGNICWFTNLPQSKRNEKLILVEKYDPNKYPKYDNYDAINVDRVVQIPKDYYEVIGVPITFLDKYCPEQFEIVGIANNVRWIGDFPCYTIINGQKIYNRILIKRKSDNKSFI